MTNELDGVQRIEGVEWMEWMEWMEEVARIQDFEVLLDFSALPYNEGFKPLVVRS